jgi:Zn finger protein HypA/HybF involved in hydrogenase expression
MAHALESVTECTILRAHPVLTFTAGKYSYRIERKGDQSIYSVSDGAQTFSTPIGWAFGLGAAGQTYVYERDGSFYQMRVSYYKEINGLDLTMGAANRNPASLADAAGQLMDRDERAACFGCHATNATHGKDLTLATMAPGIQCERCHGPTEDHLKGIKLGDAKLAEMKKLKSLSTEEISNFCGQCHRTWEQIAPGGKLGIVDIRFQPYRLTNSKCYDTEDTRISCITCHDPHREVDKIDSHYDAKCLACHGGGKPGTAACKIATQNCAGVPHAKAGVTRLA